MKTTVDIQDELLARAKRHAKSTGRPLRVVVNEGLRHVPTKDAPYRVRDLSVGDPDRTDPLESFSWPSLREMIYEDRPRGRCGRSVAASNRKTATGLKAGPQSS